MTRARELRPGRGEEGTSLIIALIFLVAMGLVIVAIVGLAGTNIENTANLQTTRGVEYAADGVVDGAIQLVRHESPSATGTTVGSPSTTITGTCSNTFNQTTSGSAAFSAGTINTQNEVAYCFAGNTGTGRVVTFVACPSNAGSYSQCTAEADLVAVVTYNDQTCNTSTFTCTYNPPTTSGTGLAVNSWILQRSNG